ncbi:hypothetical protein HAX54_027815 [Datura stramonium]|uniref:Uncharacterized protein n=1 Tax=Datura stramonium TaxID=4076 RepID=A0ABS8V579_DATST|nr:hypothetical protein [Datura stramonium]
MDAHPGLKNGKLKKAILRLKGMDVCPCAKNDMVDLELPLEDLDDLKTSTFRFDLEDFKTSTCRLGIFETLICGLGKIEDFNLHCSVYETSTYSLGDPPKDYSHPVTEAYFQRFASIEQLIIGESPKSD